MPHTELHAPESFAWLPSAQQQVFRCLMTAFSYPGRVLPLSAVQATSEKSTLIHILATLLDGEVGLADPDSLITPSDRLRLEAPSMLPEQAPFVVALAEFAPNFSPNLGSLENPEFGATLILKVASLSSGQTLNLTGPGIQAQAKLTVQGLHPGWLAARTEWNCAFPMGVDLLLIDEARVVALPRTTRIQNQGEH